MYAIVKTGGKQYRVAAGDVLQVEKVAAEPGDEITLEPVLVVADGDVRHGAALAKAAVTGRVVSHDKGPKIRILKYKNKTRYHKRQGHRQPLTTIEITTIAGGE